MSAQPGRAEGGPGTVEGGGPVCRACMPGGVVRRLRARGNGVPGTVSVSLRSGEGQPRLQNDIRGRCGCSWWRAVSAAECASAARSTLSLLPPGSFLRPVSQTPTPPARAPATARRSTPWPTSPATCSCRRTTTPVRVRGRCPGQRVVLLLPGVCGADADRKCAACLVAGGAACLPCAAHLPRCSARVLSDVWRPCMRSRSCRSAAASVHAVPYPHRRSPFPSRLPSLQPS